MAFWWDYIPKKGREYQKYIKCNTIINRNCLQEDKKYIDKIFTQIFEYSSFIDPEYQDRGVGTRTWQFVEDTYPDTKQWTLETPSWAVKNHYFYEQKCGFKKIEEKVEKSLDPPGTLFVYQKVMEGR